MAIDVLITLVESIIVAVIAFILGYLFKQYRSATEIKSVQAEIQHLLDEAKNKEREATIQAQDAALKIKAAAAEVKVDMTELEFCNSSGFKSFIYWVERIRSLPEGRRYQLVFLSNPARRWQRTSLLALSCYGVESVRIQ